MRLFGLWLLKPTLVLEEGHAVFSVSVLFISRHILFQQKFVFCHGLENYP